MGPGPVKTAAVLFSGGDSPGMNAFLRAFVRLGINRHEAAILGVRDGYKGLVRTCERLARGELTAGQLRAEMESHRGLAGLLRPSQDLIWMDHRAVTGLVSRGGIVLGASRCPKFLEHAVRSQVIGLLTDLDVNAVVVVGGEGSLTGAACLAKESNLQVIGVPATIDNDLSVTDMAVGVDTAVNTIIWAIKCFTDTASSHHRIMVLETMGRECGELARMAALASGAEIVVTPERGPRDQPKLTAIAERLENSMVRGRNHGIVLVAEGVKVEPPGQGGPGSASGGLAKHLQDHFRRPGGPLQDIEVRASILGHLQRGGSPTAADRILAARFAEAAWEHISTPARPSGIVGLRGGRIGLQEFGVQPIAEQQEAAQKMCELQKTLSKW